VTRLSRVAELANNLAAVRARIDAACQAVDRHPDEVTLVAVTKTHPLSDVEVLVGLGLRHMGENRDQEASVKAAKASDEGLDVVWHFVGQVQTNKARSVASYADVVEAVDRTRLADALSHAVTRAGRTLDVLVQVALADGEGRGGARLDDGFRTVLELAAHTADAPGLRLAGVMAVAPLGADPDKAFGRLAAVAAAVRAEHPGATMVSAGMSADLEAAIGYGSTHVRVGTALLGARFAPIV
jgi:PLP dependent protein